MRIVDRAGLRLLVFPSLEELGLLCAISTLPLDVRDQAQSERLLRALGLDPARAVTPRQVHHATVLEVHRRKPAQPPEADGLVTDVPGQPLLLRAADCSLIVVADPVRRAVGVAHAGWRGSARGIVVNLVKAMAGAYGTRPADCRAAVGPTISARNYPVGPEVPVAFLRNRAWASAHVFAKEGRLHFDLPGANARFLEEAGIPPASIEVSDLCTFEAQGLLHSFRRNGPGAGHHGLVAAWPRFAGKAPRERA